MLLESMRAAISPYPRMFWGQLQPTLWCLGFSSFIEVPLVGMLSLWHINHIHSRFIYYLFLPDLTFNVNHDGCQTRSINFGIVFVLYSDFVFCIMRPVILLLLLFDFVSDIVFVHINFFLFLCEHFAKYLILIFLITYVSFFHDVYDLFTFGTIIKLSLIGSFIYEEIKVLKKRVIFHIYSMHR